METSTSNPVLVQSVTPDPDEPLVTASLAPPHTNRVAMTVSFFVLLLLLLGAAAAYTYVFPNKLQQTQIVVTSPLSMPTASSPEPLPTSADVGWAIFSDPMFPVTFTYPTNVDMLGAASGNAITLSYPQEASPDNYLFLVIGLGELGDKSLQAYANDDFLQAKKNQDQIISPLTEIKLSDRTAYTYTAKEIRAPEELRRYVYISVPNSAYRVSYMEQIKGKDTAEFKQVSERILESFADAQKK